MGNLPLSPDSIRSIALETGFDLVRFGPADPGEHGDHFVRWLEAGRNGEMHYLAENRDRILAPATWRSGVHSAIALAVDYGGPAGELPGGGRVARYAVGRDYHRWLRERVFTLRQRLDSAAKHEVQAALARHAGRWTPAARELGLTASNLQRLAGRLGLRR